MLANYDAVAYINGGSDYPDIIGTVGFKKAGDGTWVDADIKNLPAFMEATEDSPQIGPHGFHIHEKACAGYNFEDAGGHWNKHNAPHGNHMGDLPSLFSNDGKAKMLVYTNKFTPDFKFTNIYIFLFVIKRIFPNFHFYLLVKIRKIQ